jgi:hypothetical protein
MIVTLIQNRISYNSSEEISSLSFYFNYGKLKSKNIRELGMSAFAIPALTFYRTCTLFPYLLSVNLYASIKEEDFN